MDDACSTYSNAREGLCERGIYEPNEEYLVRERMDDEDVLEEMTDKNI